MTEGAYRKIKDAWYYGPANKQHPEGLHHLHAHRGSGLRLYLEAVWCMDNKDWGDAVPIIETLGEVDTIYACNCGAIAPDDVVDMITKNATCDRRAAVAHTKAKV